VMVRGRGKRTEDFTRWRDRSSLYVDYVDYVRNMYSIVRGR
jgi:hypothetical protein